MKELYVPTKEQINELLKYSKTAFDGIYYVPIFLGVCGLRKTEIMAISSQNVNKNVINYRSFKESKDYSLDVPQDVADIIVSQGYAYKESSDVDIKIILDSFCKSFNVPHFSFVSLRKYYLTEYYFSHPNDSRFTNRVYRHYFRG